MTVCVNIEFRLARKRPAVSLIPTADVTLADAAEAKLAGLNCPLRPLFRCDILLDGTTSLLSYPTLYTK